MLSVTWMSPMFCFAIAATLISPAAYLATGFYRVSRRRAEEGRQKLSPVYRSVIRHENTAPARDERLAA